jgi:dolichol-phosphate mannosyltransferase
VDPSGDGTERVIREELKRNDRIGMIAFSRRFGQPAAVAAGLEHCRGNYVVVIDVDLQDPPELIQQLYEKAQEGFDVVYAKRRSREGETLVKLFVSWLGYKVINAVTDVQIPRNTGDFRIMNRRVIDEVRKLKERHGFLRGLVAYVGFRQGFVEYDRAARAIGLGHYNRYFGSLKIGLNGLVGFSNFLLSTTLLAGLVICGVSFLAAILIVVTFFVGTQYPAGTPTIIVLILFMGGVQLISIGILGEYIGRIYEEVKRRPQYIIKDAVNVKHLAEE